jgi:dihydrodipicolinate synthase/N-acetylneuraminate lyase
MALRWQDWSSQALAALRKGVVIPAHPLALDSDRKLDSRRQRALTRYYLDAGAGGLAVGVHTTQFAIREAGLFAPVLELAMRGAAERAHEPPIMIAGLAGRTAQAVKEAQVARGLGYHAGLLSLAALKGAGEDELIGHAQAIAHEIPLVGFYLQPAVGGLVLPVSFWRHFAAIENVVAIKIAPFNRYRTLDVVRGVVEAGAADRVTLYTGNDDHIILDLLTPFTVVANGRAARPLERVGEAGGRAARPHPRVGRFKHRARRSAGARVAGHRLQRGDLRCRQRLPRRHRWLP